MSVRRAKSLDRRGWVGCGVFGGNKGIATESNTIWCALRDADGTHCRYEGVLWTKPKLCNLFSRQYSPVVAQVGTTTLSSTAYVNLSLLCLSPSSFSTSLSAKSGPRPRHEFG